MRLMCSISNLLQECLKALELPEAEEERSRTEYVQCNPDDNRAQRVVPVELTFYFPTLQLNHGQTGGPSPEIKSSMNAMLAWTWAVSSFILAETRCVNSNT